MPRCSFYTGDSHRCQNNATLGLEGVPDHTPLCRIHAGKYRRTVERYNGVHVHATGCLSAGRHGWCPEARIDGNAYCADHIEFHIRRAGMLHNNDLIRQQEAAQRNAILDGLLERIPRPPWQEVMVELFNRPDLPEPTRYQIAFAFFIRTTDDALTPVFRVAWAALEAQAQPPPPPARGTLRALAADTQNVHTRAVTVQTQALEEKLLAIPIPETQQTELAMAQEWLHLVPRTVAWRHMLRTLNDIHRWFGTVSCRQEDDNLYRRLLRGVVAKINRTDSELRAELYRRLWEECHEATGMCCEGHISRLCNVFVGFDEAFQPPVSLGELLQNKMAAIAGLDASEEEKRRQATEFFNQHAIPAEERVAWLDAF